VNAELHKNHINCMPLLGKFNECYKDKKIEQQKSSLPKLEEIL
jgi:hypothetical protein